MLAQPRGERVGLAISKQIDGPVSIEIDQHRAIDMPAAQREIIHPQHRHGPDLRVGQGPNQPQHRAPGGR